MPPCTLKAWVQRSASGEGMKNKYRGPKGSASSSKKIGLEEKLKILLESANLAEAELGEYLRRHGLHKAQIEEWKLELQEALRGPSRAERSNENKLRFEKVRLEKDLHRKDKALAEATALLILKKKASLLWGTDEGDEE